MREEPHPKSCAGDRSLLCCLRKSWRLVSFRRLEVYRPEQPTTLKTKGAPRAIRNRGIKYPCSKEYLAEHRESKLITHRHPGSIHNHSANKFLKQIIDSEGQKVG